MYNVFWQVYPLSPYNSHHYSLPTSCSLPPLLLPLSLPPPSAYWGHLTPLSASGMYASVGLFTGACIRGHVPEQRVLSFPQKPWAVHRSLSETSWFSPLFMLVFWLPWYCVGLMRTDHQINEPQKCWEIQYNCNRVGGGEGTYRVMVLLSLVQNFSQMYIPSLPLTLCIV